MNIINNDCSFILEHPNLNESEIYKLNHYIMKFDLNEELTFSEQQEYNDLLNKYYE